MKVAIRQCQKRLAITWLVGTGILFTLLILQSIFGRYGDKAGEAWAWLLPTILPTLSLIMGVLASDALAKNQTAKRVDKFVYRIAMSLSLGYLIVVSSTVFLNPFSAWTPLELMRLSNLWLAPLQGIVAAAIGVFFVSREA
jgi:hypothetical protein